MRTSIFLLLVVAPVVQAQDIQRKREQAIELVEEKGKKILKQAEEEVVRAEAKLDEEVHKGNLDGAKALELKQHLRTLLRSFKVALDLIGTGIIFGIGRLTDPQVIGVAVQQFEQQAGDLLKDLKHVVNEVQAHRSFLEIHPSVNISDDFRTVKVKFQIVSTDPIKESSAKVVLKVVDAVGRTVFEDKKEVPKGPSDVLEVTFQVPAPPPGGKILITMNADAKNKTGFHDKIKDLIVSRPIQVQR